MRAFLFFISLFTLLTRSDHSAARTPDVHLQYAALQQQIKTADSHLFWTLDEDNLDSVEELYSGDQDKAPQRAILVKNLFSEYWLTPDLDVIIPINTGIQQSLPPFFGCSYPIYITNRVLRI